MCICVIFLKQRRNNTALLYISIPFPLEASGTFSFLLVYLFQWSPPESSIIGGVDEMGGSDALEREDNRLTRKRQRSPLYQAKSDTEITAEAGSEETSLTLVFTLVPVGKESSSSGNFQFGTEGARIGREPSCDICLSLKEISRVHCVFSVVGGRVYIRDLSFNGTFVNARLVGRDRSVELVDGDMISVINPFLKHAAAYSYTFLMPWHGSALSSSSLSSSSVTAKYTLGAMVGQGSYATVYAATVKETGEQVAIKVLDKRRFFSDISEKALRLEAELIRGLRHQNIIQVFDTIDTDDTLALVMELVPGGDLFDYVVGRGKCPFTEDEARSLFRQLVEPVRYIHGRNVVHCDLKPENVLVAVRGHSRSSNGEDSAAGSTSPIQRKPDSITPTTPIIRSRGPQTVPDTLVEVGVEAGGNENHVPSNHNHHHALPMSHSSAQKLSPYEVQLKLTDFGVAQYCRRRASRCNPCSSSSPPSISADAPVFIPPIGTPAYAAPELLGSTICWSSSSSDTPPVIPTPAPSADIWSLGVLLYILCSGSRPKRRTNPTDPLVFHPHMNNLSDSCKDLLCGLLAMNPKDRLTMEELMRHPWWGKTSDQLRVSPGNQDIEWSLTASPTSPRYSVPFS